MSRRAASRCWRSSARRRDTAKRCARGVDYLRRTQTGDGSWYGRWGLNYIYGTWSVLCALNACGVDVQSPEIRKAVDLARYRIQNPDGGWGEDGTSYRLDYRGHEPAASTASQTAWALLGLMAGGEVDHPAVARGIALSAADASRGRILGRGALHRHRVSRAFSICAITATGNFSRCGRSRAIGICTARQRRTRVLRHVSV